MYICDVSVSSVLFWRWHGTGCWEAPEQPDPVTYKQLVSPRTPYPKTRVLWLLFPPSYLNTQTLSQSPQKSQCIFFLNFAFCSLALTDGGRIQASCPKQRDDLCSISGFPCQALKLSSLSLILQRLVISVTKDRLLTNQEMTFARNSCHKSPFPRPPVHEPAEMSLRKSRNWIMSDLQEHSVF